MSEVKTKPHQQQQTTSPTIVREEIASLESEIIRLEKKEANSFILFQMLRKWISFTPVKEKLQWARFKLKLKEEELFVLLH